MQVRFVYCDPKNYWRSAIIFSRSFRQSDSCPPDVFWYSAIRAGDTDPRKVAFRYKLEDRDKAWEDAGARRQAFYNDPPPGRYRFGFALYVTQVPPHRQANR